MRFSRILTTIDCHAAGEPLRIVTGGVPRIPGESILDKRAWAQTHLDGVRRVLMLEPRGHADMYGCFLTEPVRPDSHTGVLFLHNEGFSTMCGHGVIGLTTALIETGQLAPTGELTEVRLDTPAGQVVARAQVEGDEAPRVRSVSFRNVPSFVFALDLPIATPSLGELRVDVAYGGAFYALVDAERLDVPIAPGNIGRLIGLGMEIKHAIEARHHVVHPEDARLAGIYGTIICDRPSGEHADARNLTVFAEGEVDRSPCGTGTCARMAQLHARGRLPLGQPFRHESGVGTVFTGRLVGQSRVGIRPHAYDAVVPEVSGSAWLTGFHQFVVDPDDPLRDGFLLR